MSSPSDVLRDLAAAYRIDTEYHDWRGRPCTVSAQTLRAVLAAFDVDARDDDACRAALDAHRHAPQAPSCFVVRAGRETTLPIGLATIDLEAGGTREMTAIVPSDLPTGYHRVTTVRDGVEHTAALIVTPDVLGTVPAEPVWGLATQLYSVRSAGSWGTGDLGDLAELARWSATEHGADFVLVNPLHAAEVVAPMTASPYLPSTRRFANPLYLRPSELPGWPALDAATRADLTARGRALLDAGPDLLDRDAAWALRREALAALFAASGPDEGFAAYRAREGAALDRFATWAALTEVHGANWRDWPAELHDADGAAVARAAVEHSGRIEFHRWVQWQLDLQLAAAQRGAREAGMSIGIVHDHAVGVNPDGADAWMYQDVLARGVTVGAPPDDYSQLGQDWQQPPWRPDRLAAAGYAPLIEVFRAALRHGGGLRVDHIIGLFRLWWIPAGTSAAEGTYVHYDHDAVVGILALEAERAGAIIIGEDLGNVQPSTRHYLAERGLFGTSILWFEHDGGAPLRPERWRRHCLASVTTHDLPPTTGYLAGDHIRLRERLGLLTRPVDEEIADDEHAKAAWLDELRRLDLLAPGPASDDDIVVALHAYLTRTPALLRCAALTDVVGERRTQNQPGTSQEQYPNWRIPLGDATGAPVLLEDVAGDARVARVIAAVRGRSGE